jgi:hypothetical protein
MWDINISNQLMIINLKSDLIWWVDVKINWFKIKIELGLKNKKSYNWCNLIDSAGWLGDPIKSG